MSRAASETHSSAAERSQFYVLGCDGASAAEATALIMCLPLLGAAAEVVKGAAVGSATAGGRGPAQRGRVLVVEFAVGLLPLVLLTMGGFLQPVETCLTLLALLIPLALQQLLTPAAEAKGDTARSAERSGLAEAVENVVALRGCRYVGAFRGLLMLGTCVCILAVDFRAFPRRHAKTHAWGFSLMDVGVGGVVLAGGLVMRGADHGAAPAWRERAMCGLRTAAPCWALWFARLWSVKALDYQEQVGEYGVHWNFFATVAFVVLAHHTLASGMGWQGQAAMAAGVCLLHQAALSLGLGEWARSEERASDLLSLNKEGITSLPGFVCLSLAGSALGQGLRAALQPACRQVLLQLGEGSSGPSPKSVEVAAQPRWRMLWPLMSGPLAVLVAVDLTMWALVLVLDTWVERPCRRCANATYVLWVCATSLLVLVLLLASQLLLPSGLRPLLLQAASRNMLPLFLVANLMTGAVNLSMDTLRVSDFAARGLVATYLGVLCALLACLGTRSIKLRV